MSRPQICRHICSKPKCASFGPCDREENGIVVIGYDEYETIRLIDYENYTQSECAEKMQVARTTVTRMYDNARKKIADSLVNCRKLTIYGGDVTVCTCMKPECKNETHCCHKKSKDML